MKKKPAVERQKTNIKHDSPMRMLSDESSFWRSNVQLYKSRWPIINKRRKLFLVKWRSLAKLLRICRSRIPNCFSNSVKRMMPISNLCQNALNPIRYVVLESFFDKKGSKRQ